MRTTYSDAVTHFAARSARAARELARWRTTSDAAKVEFVESAVTEVAYAQTPETIDAVCAAGDHPLGNIRKKDIVDIDAATNWYPDFAFHHVLHHATASLQTIPTFAGFQAFCSNDPLAHTMLVLPAAEARAAAERAGADPSAAWDAVRWRIGLAYYSFLREMYSLAVLRAAGIDARYHVLADVLWRVDLWVGDLCLELYVNSPRFKSHDAGRKTRSRDWLGDGPFAFAKFEIARRTEFGVAHLPDPDDLVRVVRLRLAGDA